MAVTKMLNWPTTQESYGQKRELSPEGQYRAACAKASALLEVLKKEHPGEKITIAFQFAGFIPFAKEDDHDR